MAKAKKPIFVIAELQTLAYYRTFSLREGGVEVHPFSEPVCSMQYRDADLLLIDCGSDVERGLDLLAEVKSLRPDIPVIFLTDAGSEHTAIKAFRLGAREYIKKPCKMFELKNAIETLLKVKEISHEKRIRYQIDNTDAAAALVLPLTTRMPPHLLRVVDFIEKNLSEAITIEQLAKEAGLSKYHFCRTFKRAAGVSPMNFVASMRIERSKELLARRVTVSIAAIKVGFNDLSNFIRQFKRLTGLTPNAYKASLKGAQPPPFCTTPS